MAHGLVEQKVEGEGVAPTMEVQKQLSRVPPFARWGFYLKSLEVWVASHPVEFQWVWEMGLFV